MQVELVKISRSLWRSTDKQFNVTKGDDGRYVAWKGARLTKTSEVARGLTLGEIRDQLGAIEGRA